MCIAQTTNRVRAMQASAIQPSGGGTQPAKKAKGGAMPSGAATPASSALGQPSLFAGGVNLAGLLGRNSLLGA